MSLLSVHGSPWREKTAVKFATSLPNRIIDSIMAQGNWNILFQEGPFAEFQRQIAVANHFAQRGETRLAEQYFVRADTALEIAYGSLRGRFGWPRSATNLNANDLQWGENRDTFQDYVLCRLQIYLESGLISHENGALRYADFESTIGGYQRQLGVPLQKKEPELDIFVRLIREALSIRTAADQNLALHAERFAVTSDRIANDGKTYWNRRIIFFRIFEHLHHGNLGRARFLAGAYSKGNAEQHDNLTLIRILIRCSDYTSAREVAAKALASEGNQRADSYEDYLRYSQLMQNLAVWLGDKVAAGKTASATVTHLESLLKSEQIARDEIVDVRNAIENQKLQAQKHAYLSGATCPPAAGDAAEHEIEWRVRERLFHENCGKTIDRVWWRTLLASTEASTEIKAIAAQRLEGEKAADNFLERTARDENTTGLLRFFAARHRLQTALMRRKSKALPELLANYLRSANHLHADLIFLDWGIKVGDNLSALAIDKMPAKISDNLAAAVFTELHRRFALETLRGTTMAFFSPPDAAALMHHIVPALLDTPTMREKLVAGQQFLRHDLWFSHNRLHLHYDAEKGKLTRYAEATDLAAAWGTDLPKRESMLFGNVLLFSGKMTRPAMIAPLFFYCSQCSRDTKLPDRLVAPGTSAKSSTLAELSDTFSTAPDPGTLGECSGSGTAFRDTVLIDNSGTDLRKLPCDLRMERLVTGQATDARALLAMGWRKDLYTMILPDTLSAAERIALLYDLFQRTNRRQMPFMEAFTEATARAEKSFPQGGALKSVQVYASFH